jgi:DNA-binding response OmpR family regulator
VTDPAVDVSTPLDLTAPPLEDGRPRVLIVDDEADIRDWLRLELRERGWLVNCARDVAEGTEMALRLRPHVVLLDQRLPDGRGLDAGRRLREERPDVHLILFSAYLDLDAEEEAARLGIQTISKVDRTALFATIGAHHDALTAAVSTG